MAHDIEIRSLALRRGFERPVQKVRYNEDLRRSERVCQFKVEGLKQVLAQSSARPLSALTSLTKLAEGGFNRILQATFEDGHQVIARIPYPIVTPARHAVASEAATLSLLRSQGLPVPKVLGYSATCDNPVGVEYLLLEKVPGSSLGDRWNDFDNRSRKRIMEQVVEIEKQLFAIRLPASGSLYHRRDLSPNEACVPLFNSPASPDGLVVGPIVQHEWCYKERAQLYSHRGPWVTFRDCFEAAARKELEWCKIYAKPRLHVERYLREMHSLQELDPAEYQILLKQCLEITPFLDLAPNSPLSRPVLRHPDLSPNNILVSEDDKILGLIDWQYATILPLCLAAGIPKYFQNWGDPISERLSKPDTDLPEDYDKMTPQQQSEVKDSMQKRLTHFLYAAGTMLQIPDHFSAISQHNAMLRNRLYSLASTPWEGDSLTLKRTMIEAVQSWPLPLNQPDTPLPAASGSPYCPIQFSEQEIEDCLQAYETQEEELQELISMREYLDVDPQGWVPDDDHWGKSKEMARGIKEAMLQHATKTELTRRAILDHFPFDDHEEE